MHTPKVFFRDELNIAPSEGSAHNVDREIAEFNVKETLRLAKETIGECDVAVIQGSKYLDLRIECLKGLEEIGYNGFIIANGDALLTNSRDLVEIVVSLKKQARKTSYFIFPFAELSFMPILMLAGLCGIRFVIVHEAIPLFLKKFYQVSTYEARGTCYQYEIVFCNHIFQVIYCSLLFPYFRDILTVHNYQYSNVSLDTPCV